MTSINHATTATGTDAGTGDIHKAQWNADHVITPVYRGYNTIGGTRLAWPSAHYALATKITAGSTGDLLLAVQGYVDQTANAGDYWAAGLWTDDSGTVGRLIAASSPLMPIYLGGTGGTIGAYPARWFGPGFSPTILTASTDYWIGLVIDGSAGPGIYYDTGGSDRSVNQSVTYVTDGERWGQTNLTYKLSIRGLVIPL